MKPIKVGMDINTGNAGLMRALLENLQNKGIAGAEILANAQAKFLVEDFPKETFQKLQQQHTVLQNVNYNDLVFYVRVEGPKTDNQKWKLQINGDVEAEILIYVENGYYDGGINLDERTLEVIEQTKLNLGL